MQRETIVIFGGGWLANKLKDFYSSQERLQSHGVYILNADITDRPVVEKLLDEFRPSVVINAAGKPSGGNNIDWCVANQANRMTTYRSNVLGPQVLAQSCLFRGIYFVHLSSGCIFDGPSPGSNGWTEEDVPLPVSFYSWMKVLGEDLIEETKQKLDQGSVLVLRLRLPVDGLPHPRNLITKVTKPKRLLNFDNSVTVVSDFVTATTQLITQRATGTYHVANPGFVSHREIIGWYREFVNPNHECEFVSADELYSDLSLVDRRSNCILDSTKLQRAGIVLPDAKTAVRRCLKEYAQHLSIQKP